MKYEPYKTDAFKELMMIGYNLGWYSGRKKLFTLTMEGEFEGWSGRASETWEQRFVIETEEIEDRGKILHPAIKVDGETLEDACLKAIELLKIN